MENFILTLPNILSSETCLSIINRFEQDPNKTVGVTSLGYEEDIKKTTELCISGKVEWKDIDDLIFKTLSKAMEQYHDKYPILKRRQLIDHGYYLKRYQPGDFFDWHADNNDKSVMARQYIAIFYLNDVKEGGETEFKYFDSTIKPVSGSVTFFPASWTHEHRGVSPISNNKYIITAWMSLA